MSIYTKNNMNFDIISRQEIMDSGIPNIELKNQVGKDFGIERLRGTNEWDIIKFNNKEEIHILLGKGHIITSIEEFNKKCSALFGFTLYATL